MNNVPKISQKRAALAAIVASALGCALLVHGAAAQAPKSGAAPAGNVAQGKDAFTTSCSLCHGEQAEGAMGPQIAGTSFSFSDFANRVRTGKGAMPPFDSATVPDAQIANIYAYLKSLPAAPESGAGGASPSPRGSPSTSSTVPAQAATTFAPAASGNADHGKTIFMSYGCYECHGRVGQGSAQTGGARIGPPPIPVAAFAAYIRHPTGNMPPYAAKAVPDQDVADIYAYLQSIKAPPAAKDIPLLNQ